MIQMCKQFVLFAENKSISSHVISLEYPGNSVDAQRREKGKTEMN